jgi:hypothetical protein
MTANHSSNEQQIIQAVLNEPNQALNVSIVGGAIVTQAPIQILQNGTEEFVSINDATPADNVPIPVVLLSGDASAPVAMGSGATTAGTLRVTVATDSLLATAANQVIGNSTLSTISGQLPASLGAKAASASLSVVPATGSVTPTVASGKAAINHVNNVYSTTNVTSSAYVQILASTSAAVSEVEIFDSSGQTLILATGAPGLEVDQVYITPGGNGRIPLAIATGTRVSVKALSTSATVGILLVNMYG